MCLRYLVETARSKKIKINKNTNKIFVAKREAAENLRKALIEKAH